MKNLIIISAISSLTLFGCATTNISEPSSPLHSSVEAPLKANIKVGQKISGEAKATQIFGLINLGPTKFADGVDYGTGGVFHLFDTFTPVKAAAAYEATINSNADIIVAPRYVIETKDYFVIKTTTATVTGYKGTIEGVIHQ
jgi:hypothetical protein